MENNMLVSCAIWQEKLATLHPADLSSAERVALDVHVASCSACTAALADYKKIKSLLSKVLVSKIELPEWLMQDDLKVKLPPLPPLRPPQNLPPRFGEFFGRQAELEWVLGGLRSSLSFLVIEGMGGVGKTTLALEVAYQCLQGSDSMSDPLFDFAIWISARARLEQKHWLNEILDTIARGLDYPSVAQSHLDKKRTSVNELLCTHRTLVIIDNFDTIDDPELLTWIQQVPKPSKVLVTSRDTHQLRRASIFHLEGLKGDDALDLIRHHAQRLELPVIESAEVKDLLHVTRGNPQAIAMILGGFKSGGLSLHQTLDGLHDTSNILDDLFAIRWVALAENVDAQHVLLALSFFASSASNEAVSRAAGVSDLRLERALIRLTELSLIEVYDGLEETKTRYSLHPLTRAFVSTKLKEMPDWEQEARKRWGGWWLAFTRAHGGPDGIEWAQQYDPIEEEWENLVVVCEWCMAHDQYETLRDLWHTERLLWMTSIYGYWKERIASFQWIRQTARRRGAKATEVEAMAEQGFTLTQMGQVDEAEKILNEAWEQRHFASLGVQITLAGNIVQWHIRTNNLTGAESWLKKANRRVYYRNLSESERPRYLLTIKYYYGVMHIARGDRKRAETYFKKTLAGAEAIGWQRCVIYVQQFLADIARARGKFDEAEELLKTGLEVSERNKDRRRTAYYKRSLAYLALQRGRRNQLAEVINWAEQALDGFERLGMQPEVSKLRRLLGHLQAVSSPPSVENGLQGDLANDLVQIIHASSPQSVEDVLQEQTDVSEAVVV